MNTDKSSSEIFSRFYDCGSMTFIKVITVGILLVSQAQAVTITVQESFDNGTEGVKPDNMFLGPLRGSPGEFTVQRANNYCDTYEGGGISLINKDCPPNSQAEFYPWRLNFHFGGGSSVAFEYATTAGVITGGEFSFRVNGYGFNGDGDLYKYVCAGSADCITKPDSWIQVGDASGLDGTVYTLPLISGYASTYAIIQVGNQKGPYDGVWVDNVSATYNLAGATYDPLTKTVVPAVGPEIPRPDQVPGKEYSSENDTSSLPTGVTLDDQQNTMWNGKGGVDNTFDYNNNDATSHSPQQQVDELANVRDALFHAARTNNAAILFSTRVDDNGGGIDYGAPSNGCAQGDPICSEAIDGTVRTWATWPQVDKNWNNPTTDPNGLLKNLDALEVWAPDPPNAMPPGELTNQGNGTAADGIDDANRFTLFDDSANNCAIFAGTGPGANCYATHDEIAALFPGVASSLIDIDGLMVFDEVGDTSSFDIGDWLMFSLWPIAGQAGFDVGDAVYVWQKGAQWTYLDHGDHLWTNNWLGLNIDALEAVATPEPSSIMLFALGLASMGASRFRKHSKVRKSVVGRGVRTELFS